MSIATAIEELVKLVETQGVVASKYSRLVDRLIVTLRLQSELITEFREAGVIPIRLRERLEQLSIAFEETDRAFAETINSMKSIGDTNATT